MNLYLHLKWLFRMLSNSCFFLTTSRVERYTAYKIKVLHSKYQRTSDFTTSTMTSTRKCLFIIVWALQTNSRNSAHVEWLLGPCGKKVAAVCNKWTS